MSARRVSVRAGELVVTAGDVALEADVHRGAVVCVRATAASVGGACHIVAGRSTLDAAADSRRLAVRVASMAGPGGALEASIVGGVAAREPDGALQAADARALESVCAALDAHGVRVVRMVPCGAAPRRLTFRVATGALDVRDR